MTPEELQSWAKCSGCEEVLWVEPSEHEQRASCLCGGITLHDDRVTGSPDGSFTEPELQELLDEELV